MEYACLRPEAGRLVSTVTQSRADLRRAASPRRRSCYPQATAGARVGVADTQQLTGVEMYPGRPGLRIPGVSGDPARAASRSPGVHFAPVTCAVADTSALNGNR